MENKEIGRNFDKYNDFQYLFFYENNKLCDNRGTITEAIFFDSFFQHF